MPTFEEISKGNLGQRPLAEVIGQIYSSRLTGEMQLTAKKAEYKIYFFNGTPVFAQSSLASDNILELMVHLGQLERDDVPKLRGMIEEGMETDKAILQMGLADPTKLYYLKMLLAREIIIRACEHREGTYQFHAQNDFMEHIQLYDLSPMEIIYEAINRHQVLSLAKKLLKMSAAKVRLNPDLDELQSLPEIYYDRTYLLDEFREEMPLEKAIMLVSAEFKDLNNALLFLYVMMVTGVLLVTDEKTAPPKLEPKAEAATKPRQVERIYEKPPEPKTAQAEPEKTAAGSDYIYKREKPTGRTTEKISETRVDWKQQSVQAAKQKETEQAEIEKSRKLELLESKIRSSEDYFQVLGIRPDTPVGEVEKVYQQLLDQFELEDLRKDSDPELSKRASEAREAL